MFPARRHRDPIQGKETKKKFSQEEDDLLVALVTELGTSNWERIAVRMDGRPPRRCRERYMFYLQPGLVCEPWTPDEDDLLINLCNQFGTKWKTILQWFPKRTEPQLKNRGRHLDRRHRLRLPIVVGQAMGFNVPPPPPLPPAPAPAPVPAPALAPAVSQVQSLPSTLTDDWEIRFEDEFFND
jgi:hypothetical protein